MGTRRQIGDSAAPSRDSKGEITGVVMVFSDVTEQYQAREDLAQSEARYRTIVENINDALFIRDFEGNIVDLNEVACKMLGYKREELLGSNLAQIRSPEGNKEAPRRIEKLLETDKHIFEGNLRHKNGHYIPIEASLKSFPREGKGLIQTFIRILAPARRRKNNYLPTRPSWRSCIAN